MAAPPVATAHHFPADRATLTIPEAAHILGIGKNAAYAAADRGEIPTIRLGRKVLVPIAALRRLLGEPDTGPVAAWAASIRDLDPTPAEVAAGQRIGSLLATGGDPE